MTDDRIASLAEAMDEMGRRLAELEAAEAALQRAVVEDEQLRAENAQLRARIAELETNAAITFGTLEQPTPDEPASYTHNVPPSAPPHDE